MNHSIEVLGWTLIHFCWQAAVIALLYRVADLALPRGRSNLRYVASLAALFSMLAVSLITLGYEGMRGGQDRVTRRDSVSVTGIGETFAVLPVSDDRAAPLTEPASLWAGLQDAIRPAMPWLVAVWLLGVFCLSARTVGGWWMIQRIRRASMVRVPASARDSFAQLSLRLGIWWSVDLRICECISSPLAIGIVRSLVLLPASALTSLSPEQLEVVLAHELAHIRRADYLWNMLQTMIETLFFFHPAVWWIGRNLRQQRELCCDDIALECCADPLIFATALLRLEEERSSRLHLAMALDGHQPGGLRARIGHMLGETPRGGREIAPWSLLCAGAMLGLLLLPAHQLFAGLHATEARSADLHSRAQQAGPALASTIALPHGGKIAGDPSTDDLQSNDLPSKDQPVVAPTPPRTPKHAATVAVISPPALAPKLATIAITSRVKYAAASAPAMTVVITSPAIAAQTSAEKPSSGGDYIDQMRAAGYNVDVDKYVAMKIQGVTPEFARSMAATGFGKPTTDDLIAMKIHGVSPGEVAELKSAGIEAGSYQDLISYRIFKVSPEFVAGMKAAGYSNIPAKKLVELRIHGITPELAKATKQQFPTATLDELVQLRIFHIDEAFIASAKRHGLEPLTIEKLVRIRLSGLLDDDNQKSEKTQ